MSEHLRIQPQSWQKAGAAFTETASEFSGRTLGALGGMSVAQLGSTSGGTLADEAFAVVIPTLLDALTETVRGIAQGLDLEGQGLLEAGQAYAAMEAENTAIAEGAG